MKTHDSIVRAALDRIFRKTTVKAEVRPVGGVHNQRHLKAVADFGYLFHVAYHALKSRRGQNHRADIAFVFQLSFHRLRVNPPKDSVVVDIGIEVICLQTVDLNGMIHRLMAVSRHKDAAPRARLGGNCRQDARA